MIIQHKVVHLSNFGDFSLPSWLVFDAETIFVSGCNKNFVYYNIDKHIFPKATKLYLSSHPAEPQFFNRDFDNIYVTYLSVYKRWTQNRPNVKFITGEEFRDELSKYASQNE